MRRRRTGVDRGITGAILYDYRHPCMDCGQPCSRGSVRCQKCSGRQRRLSGPRTPSGYRRYFGRCPTCGGQRSRDVRNRQCSSCDKRRRKLAAIRICPWCHGQRRNPKRNAFCSVRCRARHRSWIAGIRRYLRAVSRYRRPCQTCGQPLGTDGLGRRQIHRTCWRPAVRQVRRRDVVMPWRPLAERVCVWCGRSFLPNRDTMRLCGDRRCRRRWDRQRQRHGLSVDMPPDLLRAFRMLADAYYLLQLPRIQGKGP